MDKIKNTLSSIVLWIKSSKTYLPKNKLTQIRFVVMLVLALIMLILPSYAALIATYAAGAYMILRSLWSVYQTYRQNKKIEIKESLIQTATVFVIGIYIVLNTCKFVSLYTIILTLLMIAILLRQLYFLVSCLQKERCMVYALAGNAGLTFILSMLALFVPFTGYGLITFLGVSFIVVPIVEHASWTIYNQVQEIRNFDLMDKAAEEETEDTYEESEDSSFEEEEDSAKQDFPSEEETEESSKSTDEEE